MYKQFILREAKDYFNITLGLLLYTFAFTVFLLPYEIVTGGIAGIGAIIFYTTGFKVEYTFFLINAALILGTLRILGWRFLMKTIYATFALSFLLRLAQEVVVRPDGTFYRLLGDGNDFMSLVIGCMLSGTAMAIVFLNNGSTGGTDIIAAIINKYRDITLGRVILICDVIIISSSYLVLHDWEKVVYGYVVLFISSFVLDQVVNSARQSVQFFIISKKYEEIGRHINIDMHRGVTIIDGTGLYTKQGVKMMFVLAKKRESANIFRLIKDIDPNAFVSQSAVIGVYGEGFDHIKVK